MPKVAVFPLLLAAALLAACEGPNRYPISGEECKPGDPVQGLDASDCIPPSG